MYRLSSIIILIGWAVTLPAQSPHGIDLAMDCAACHTSESWDIPQEFWQSNEQEPETSSVITGGEAAPSSSRFQHTETNFVLEGSHLDTDCRSCHASLVFEEANSSCISCHTDMHAQSVGTDCIRCHNTDNWLVDHIPELHEENGFPLVGGHDILSCVDCHISETNLRFDRIGNDCLNCHMDDYTNTQNPNHEAAGFSTNCLECHPPLLDSWNTDVIVHSFFPLTGGHDIQDCRRCHLTDNYSDASPDCVSCHLEDFNNTSSPDHLASGFPTDCIACHTTDPGWASSSGFHDEAYFPIYSGEHDGEWSECIECHTTANDFSVFSCIDCHEHNDAADLADEHDDVNDYVYESNACYACHPDGDE